MIHIIHNPNFSKYNRVIRDWMAKGLKDYDGSICVDVHTCLPEILDKCQGAESIFYAFAYNDENESVGILCIACGGKGIKEETLLANKKGPVNSLLTKCDKCEGGVIWT